MKTWFQNKPVFKKTQFNKCISCFCLKKINENVLLIKYLTFLEIPVTMVGTDFP